MPRIIDWGRAPESDFRALKGQIDRLPRHKALIYDNCELPHGCSPAKATVIFYREGSRYAMCVDRSFQYPFKNPAIEALKDGEPVTFTNPAMMRRFFQEIALEELPAPVSPSSAEVCDIDMVTDMSALNMPSAAVQTTLDYKTIHKKFQKYVMGQDEALETMSYQLALHGNKKCHRRPISLYLHGEPGTGKSEAAKAVAKVMSALGAHAYSVVQVDGNQLLEKDSINRVIGASQGYVGYDDAPILEAVVHNPYTVFIWDEADKCHPDIHKLLMGILDEGRCASKKELPDHSREYRFEHCIFVFTSNLRLNESPKKRIGFASADEAPDIRHENGAVEVNYPEKPSEDETAAITKRIYRQTESARKALVASGMLREIASRMGCFCLFQPLSDNAKIRILAKTVIETAVEYNIRLTFISSEIMQALIDGYLATTFAEASALYPEQAVRINGNIDAPEVTPA